VANGGTRRRLFLALALSLAVGACQQRQIEVIKKNGDRTGDYGRQAVRAAVQKFRSAPRSPQAYRALAVEIERQRPAFNRDVSDEAERVLVFLALEPMAAQLDLPFEEQMQSLALTVWPTALRVTPRADETPRAYLQRACAEQLAAECKYVVPEYWPLVLTARVWQRMKNRARDAYSECRPCKQEPSYAALLERYDQHANRVTRVFNENKARVERDAWPEAGVNAEPWSGAPVLDLLPDPPHFMGEPIEGSWSQRVRASRKNGGKVLAVHLKPRTEVRHLRGVLRVAAAAGYRTVALQARQRRYPYELREYRLAARGKAGRPVEASDTDTIQFLVRTLDATSERTGATTLRLSAR
jgi:hypothetical protein